MQKTSSTSNYDVIVVKHRNNTLKSTSFQIVFSEKAIKNRDCKKHKLKQLQLFVNDQQIDIPMRIDPKNGRVQFQKKFIRKGLISDSSDVSDDDKSQRSASRQKIISGNLKGQSIEQLKNEQVPKNFWQFAWLFSSKATPSKPLMKSPKISAEGKDEDESKLARINEEPYEGQQSSKQPLFQLSLCGNQLAKIREKKQDQEELQKIFYANKVEFKDFIKDPFTLFSDSNLVMRIDNSIYTWQLGAAVLASKFAFGVQPNTAFFQNIEKLEKRRWFTKNNVKLDIEKQPPLIQKQCILQESERVQYRKAPDSQTLQRMKLKMGENKAKLTLQITPGVFEQTQFKIFLWDQNQQIIVSDIDGTITKSDVMGQLKTNYIHKGVCLLYNQFYKRNYKMLYMTARAIGQYTQTRKFIDKEVEQNGMKLPPGPILMSPDGYLKSFARQVIQRTPDQLKIKLLASINQIFPSTKRPIIAGFGNRETDSIAYLRIKIQPHKIFCITQKSLITTELDRQTTTTYPQILQKIQNYFPVYMKPQPQLSQKSQHGPASTQGLQEQQEDNIINRRKMSHHEFHYQRSPSLQIERDIQSPTLSRARSEEGDPADVQDMQLLIEEYLSDKKKLE